MGGRVTRFAFFMAIAGAIYSQVPVGSGLSAAYGGGGGGGKTVIAAVVAAGTVYTIAPAAVGNGGIVAGGVSSSPIPAAGTPSTIGTVGSIDSVPIYDITVANPDLSTFADQADRAGLKDDLRKGGPYTVFAPTNAALTAFQTANPTAFANLQKPENKNQLKALLSYHVVRGRYTIADLKGMAEGAKLVSPTGATVTITNADDLKVNGVPVQQTDIAASNGIIHPIGTLLPAP